MKKTFTIIALLAVAASACNKAEITPNNEELVPSGKMIIETISGTSDPATKATIADEDASFSWAARFVCRQGISCGDRR